MAEVQDYYIHLVVTLSLDEKYSASFEIAKSETDEPISDAISTTNGTKNHTYALDGESFSGYGGRFTFRSNTEKWGWNYEFETKSPDFRTDLGFTPMKIIGRNTQ